MAARERIEVFPTDDDEWRWRRYSAKGDVTTDSGLQAYASSRGAIASAEEYNPGFDFRDIEVVDELQEATQEQIDARIPTPEPPDLASLGL